MEGKVETNFPGRKAKMKSAFRATIFFPEFINLRKVNATATSPLRVTCLNVFLVARARYMTRHGVLVRMRVYYIDTDEIPGFFLLLKNHIFIVGSEDTIFIFHV